MCWCGVKLYQITPLPVCKRTCEHKVWRQASSGNGDWLNDLPQRKAHACIPVAWQLMQVCKGRRRWFCLHLLLLLYHFIFVGFSENVEHLSSSTSHPMTQTARSKLLWQKGGTESIFCPFSPNVIWNYELLGIKIQMAENKISWRPVCTSAVWAPGWASSDIDLDLDCKSTDFGLGKSHGTFNNL